MPGPDAEIDRGMEFEAPYDVLMVVVYGIRPALERCVCQ